MNNQMPNYIYKDYILTDGVLIKENIDDNKHLLWSRGFFGVPCIDKCSVWDKFRSQIRSIQFSTKKGRVFRVRADTFDIYKKIVNFNFGEQYYLEKKYWTIYDPVKLYRQTEKDKTEEEKLKQAKLL